ncbi:MAG: phosphatidylserine decarboxylase family protein [Clostridia bacterium]|jgi:phosphatidylserine decarboxylase|nr:phosphatidylserine decarboxylase family protein [Clostridia bacterium]
MKKMSFDREFLVPTLFFFAATIIAYFWVPVLAVLLGILTVGVALFFRDPHRDIPAEESAIVSPADGKIIGVDIVEEKEFFNSKVKKVTIFLSVFDVHINRAPIAGEVKDVRYTAGKFLPANKPGVGATNERNKIFIEGKNFSVLVVQIAGLVARRIVCRVQPGMALGKGQKLGLIRFGSCTELYAPLETEIMVKEGDKVKGGETIIGRWRG